MTAIVTVNPPDDLDSISTPSPNLPPHPPLLLSSSPTTSYLAFKPTDTSMNFAHPHPPSSPSPSLSPSPSSSAAYSVPLSPASLNSSTASFSPFNSGQTILRSSVDQKSSAFSNHMNDSQTFNNADSHPDPPPPLQSTDTNSADLEMFSSPFFASTEESRPVWDVDGLLDVPPSSSSASAFFGLSEDSLNSSHDNFPLRDSSGSQFL